MIKIQKCLYLGAYLLQSRESRDFITDIRETDSGLFWQRCLEKEFRRLLHLSAVPVEGAKDILEYLHKKEYCLCAASNGPYNQQINRLKSADMLKYFKHCFVSEMVGADKPSRQFFDGCMKEFTGVLPSECMMIGDSLTADIEGGQAYGMSTCWFVHSGDKSAIQQKNGGKAADHIIYELAELKNIL